MPAWSASDSGSGSSEYYNRSSFEIAYYKCRWRVSDTDRSSDCLPPLRTSEQLPEQFVIEKVGIGAGKREYECVGVLRAMMIA